MLLVDIPHPIIPYCASTSNLNMHFRLNMDRFIISWSQLCNSQFTVLYMLFPVCHFCPYTAPVAPKKFSYKSNPRHTATPHTHHFLLTVPKDMLLAVTEEVAIEEDDQTGDSGMGTGSGTGQYEALDEWKGALQNPPPGMYAFIQCCVSGTTMTAIVFTAERREHSYMPIRRETTDEGIPVVHHVIILLFYNFIPAFHRWSLSSSGTQLTSVLILYVCTSSSVFRIFFSFDISSAYFSLSDL